MSMESAIAAIETPAPSQAGEQKDTPDNGLKQASEAAISTETPAPVVGEPAVEKVEPVSAKFAALVKKEKQLVLKQTALKTNEAALVDRETKLAAREQNAKDAAQAYGPPAIRQDFAHRVAARLARGDVFLSRGCANGHGNDLLRPARLISKLAKKFCAGESIKRRS